MKVAIPSDPALVAEVVQACEDRGLFVTVRDGEIHGTDDAAREIPWILRSLGYVEADTLATPRKPRYQDQVHVTYRRRR